MTTAAPTADDLAQELRECEPGQIFALIVPPQDQRDRAAALDYYGRLVAQLRRGGWELKTGVYRDPDGVEVFLVEPLAAPPTPTPAASGPVKED